MQVGQIVGDFIISSKTNKVDKYGRIRKDYWKISCVNCGDVRVVKNSKFNAKDGKFVCKCAKINLISYNYGLCYCSNGYFMFDKEDVELIKKYHWCLSRGYPRVSKTKGNGEFLHKLLLKTNKDAVVDHADRNPLNNQKYNLRITNYHFNSINRTITDDNKSGIIGVKELKGTKNKWSAYLTFNDGNNKIRYHKNFPNKQDAIKFRLHKEYLCFGDYAPQRNLFEQYGIPLDDEEFNLLVSSVKPSWIKPTYRIDIFNKKITKYDSTKEAARDNNTNSKNISKAISHNHKCAGYYWTHTEEEAKKLLKDIME